jgi:hypothetical protein
LAVCLIHGAYGSLGYCVGIGIGVCVNVKKRKLKLSENPNSFFLLRVIGLFIFEFVKLLCEIIYGFPEFTYKTPCGTVQ